MIRNRNTACRKGWRVRTHGKAPLVAGTLCCARAHLHTMASQGCSGCEPPRSVRSFWGGGLAVSCNLQATEPGDAGSRCHSLMTSPHQPRSPTFSRSRSGSRAFTPTSMVRGCRAAGGAGTWWSDSGGLSGGWKCRARGPCCRLHIKSPRLQVLPETQGARSGLYALLGRRELGTTGDPCCRSTGPSGRAQQSNPQSPNLSQISPVRDGTSRAPPKLALCLRLTALQHPAPRHPGAAPQST